MSVNWYWKEKRGEILMRDEEHKQTFKIGLYSGNMMFAMIYRYRKLNEQTNKLERYYNFLLWFDDNNHLKRTLKQDKNWFNSMLNIKSHVVKFKIKITHKSNFIKKEMLECARILTENGYKVELY